MKKLLLSIAMLVIMAVGQKVDAQHIKAADVNDYMTSVVKRANQTDRQWRKSGKHIAKSQQQRVISSIDDYFGPSSSWGSVYTPAGVEWMYSAEYNVSLVGDYTSHIESADFTIYNEDFDVYKTFTAKFELAPGDLAVNYVQMSPLLTRKFFDINDSYEVMVYVHAVTEDYNGHYYTQVYSLSDGKLINTIEGNQIGAVNTATDQWSEKYTMVFMREEVVESSDMNYQYFLYFDVYSRAGWGGGCTLEHTFKIDYSLIAGAGNNALPILINKYNNQVYYALPRYEKPYFVSDWSEELSADNHFIIDLYDSSFNLIKTTSIPMDIEEGAIFSFPGIGSLNGNDDLTFGVYDDTTNPAYVVGVENYVASMDDYVTSFYVYDCDGNKLSTLVERADDYLYMSDVDGFEQQYCFYYANEDDLGYFKFIDLPSGNEGAILDVKLDESNITTTIDRVPVGNSYQYVSSMAQADVDANNNVIHKIVWFDQDGSLNRIDGINLGKNVAMAQPYIAAHALNPNLFNTTQNYEYMFLVKEYVDINTTTRTQESLRIYDDNSQLLLNLGPNEATDEVLSSIFLINTETVNPNLIVAYYGNNAYTIHHVKLPFSKFNGGSGTASDPYIIASDGDFKAMQTAPNAYYVLASDIDMRGETWAGNKCTFTGHLDGCGYTVRNLNLKGSGIFSNIDGNAEIKNINFDGVTCIPDGVSGIIVANSDGGESAKNAPVISNISFNNVDVFSGSNDVVFGCIAGQTSLFTAISGCVLNDVNISIPYGTVGGIVGQLNTSTAVTNCLVDGKISANIAGGIAGGSLKGDEVVKNCHVHADVEGTSEAGGIIGHSSRSVINNCFVDGTVTAVGSETAYAGGIVGYMSATYESSATMTIANNIVAAKVEANKSAAQSIAHRIAGFTSIDEWLVDWDSNDPSVDWSNPSTYPYVQGSTEQNIINNFTINMSKIDDEIDDMATTTEGKSITVADLTDAFLAEQGWALGTTDDAPWKLAGKGLAFYFEDFTLSAAVTEINTTNSDAVSWTVVCASRYADAIEFAVSPEAAGVIERITVSHDGKTATCYLKNTTENGTITATLGNETVVCKLVNDLTGISDIESNGKVITYDGDNVICDGADIIVYSVAGIVVAQGNSTVSVAALPAGTYVAVSGKTAYKFVK